MEENNEGQPSSESSQVKSFFTKEDIQTLKEKSGALARETFKNELIRNQQNPNSNSTEQEK